MIAIASFFIITRLSKIGLAFAIPSTKKLSCYFSSNSSNLQNHRTWNWRFCVKFIKVFYGKNIKKTCASWPGFNIVFRRISSVTFVPAHNCTFLAHQVWRKCVNLSGVGDAWGGSIRRYSFANECRQTNTQNAARFS